MRRGGCPALLGEPVVWGWALRAGWLGEVVHPCDGGLTEEAVLVVHQVLVDAGSGTEEERASAPTHTAQARARGWQSSWWRSDMGATHLHDLWEQGLKMAEMGCA